MCEIVGMGVVVRGLCRVSPHDAAVEIATDKVTDDDGDVEE